MSGKFNLPRREREKDSHYYCLYKYTHKSSVNDSIFDVVFTDMTLEYHKEIKLDHFILSKLEKNQVFEAGSLSILPTVVSKNMVSRTTTCYYSSVPIPNEPKSLNKYIICLLTTMDNDSVSLYVFKNLLHVQFN